MVGLYLVVTLCLLVSSWGLGEEVMGSDDSGAEGDDENLAAGGGENLTVGGGGNLSDGGGQEDVDVADGEEDVAEDVEGADVGDEGAGAEGR